jgi:hypothetical protein
MQPELWDVVTSMLWVSADGVVEDFGPLLQAALPAEWLAVAATAAEGGAEVGEAAAAQAVAAAADPDAARLSALFSMCISAVKLLHEQTRARSPYTAMAKDEQTPAAVLEQIQRAVAAILVLWLECNSGEVRAKPTVGPQANSSCCSSNAAAAVLLPWATLLLRCVQLGAVWIKQATAYCQLTSTSSNRSSVRSMTPPTAAALQGGRVDPLPLTPQQQLLVANARKSLGQLRDGLRVLSYAFEKCVAEASQCCDQQQPPAVLVLPLLQQCQQQLQRELQPDEQAVLQLQPPQVPKEGVSTAASHRRCTHGIAAQQQQLQSTAESTSSSVEQQFREPLGSPAMAWHFNKCSADGSAGTGLQQQQPAKWQQQQQECETTLESLLQLSSISGKLQAWVATASSALPLRWCCNNPSCSNLGTAGSKARGSELRRVGGRQCSLCKCACYCCKVGRCCCVMNVAATHLKLYSQPAAGRFSSLRLLWLWSLVQTWYVPDYLMPAF